MSRSKVGFHGAGQGVGDYMRQLDAAGIPFHVKSISNGGYAVEAAQLAEASGLPHNIILRWPNPNGRGDDHPNLSLAPVTAADDLYDNWIKPQIDKTPEIHPYRNTGLIRIEPTNEISTKDNDPNWVGSCLDRLAQRLNNDGWAAAMGGFNNGQPELEDWLTPGMAVFLERMATTRGINTITVHEGKTTGSDMTIPCEQLVPHLIGRFTYIAQACQQLGLAIPNVEISEWGWNYKDLPGPDIVMRDLDWLAHYLAGFSYVKAAYLWNLQQAPQWSDLPKKLANMIPAITDYALITELPDNPSEPPTEPPEPTEVDYKVIVNLLPQDATLAEKDVVLKQTHTAKESMVQSANDAARLVAPGLPGSMVKSWGSERWPGEIEPWLKARGVAEVVHLSFTKIPNLGLTVPIMGAFAILEEGKFNAARDYSFKPEVKQLHEGLDFTEPPAAGQVAALAPKAGTVDAIGQNPEGYGNYIRLKHTNPILFYTYLGHLESVAPGLAAGQAVARSQQLGIVGHSGLATGDHVHLTVVVPGKGLKGYIVNDVIDPLPHVDLTRIYPPPTIGLAKFGLHATADPALAPGELSVFDLAKPEAIKVLSNLNPQHVALLRAQHKNVTWIVRAFLSMFQNGAPRVLSPEQFYNDTVADVERTIQAIGQAEILVELHNEPNLITEGLGGSWHNGADFASWWLALLAKYRAHFPKTHFMFPGLSPGAAIPGLRAEKFVFWANGQNALVAADSIGDHVYWGVGETVASALSSVNASLNWLKNRGLNRPLWITEASDKSNLSPAEKGTNYVSFWQGLKAWSQIGGITYFVASASHPDFQNEVWTKAGKSAGIAEVVGNRKG